jgi:hypothetical protein
MKLASCRIPIVSNLVLKGSHTVLITYSFILVIRVPGYRFRGPGSIPGATRFSEK